MMNYSEHEASQSSGKPIELYKIEGTYSTEFYTSQASPVKYLGDTYKPAPISRSEIRVTTSDEDNVELTVKLPISDPVIRSYAFKVAPPSLTLTVYRFHTTDDVRVFWTGPVTRVATSGTEGSLVSSSTLSAALSANCPSYLYQSPCNRTLYDDGCKLKRENYTFRTTVASIVARNVVLPSDRVYGGSGFLVNGEVLNIATRERRSIVGHQGNVIALSYPFSNLKALDQVELVAGCDHAYRGDCKKKFNNQGNFLGFPFIPNVNPFKSGIS